MNFNNRLAFNITQTGLAIGGLCFIAASFLGFYQNGDLDIYDFFTGSFVLYAMVLRARIADLAKQLDREAQEAECPNTQSPSPSQSLKPTNTNP